jgi:hypothetical protein
MTRAARQLAHKARVRNWGSLARCCALTKTRRGDHENGDGLVLFERNGRPARIVGRNAVSLRCSAEPSCACTPLPGNPKRAGCSASRAEPPQFDLAGVGDDGLLAITVDLVAGFLAGWSIAAVRARSAKPIGQDRASITSCGALFLYTKNFRLNVLPAAELAGFV